MVKLMVKFAFVSTLVLFLLSLLWNWSNYLETQASNRHFMELKSILEQVDDGIIGIKATIKERAGEIGKLDKTEQQIGFNVSYRIKTAFEDLMARISKLDNEKREIKVSKLNVSRQINIAMDEIKTRISKLDTSMRQIRISQSNVTTTAKSLPNWIEVFRAPHWTSFVKWRGVFVFFVSYRSEYLRACLESIAAASADIDKSSVCVFALDVKTPRKISQAEMNRTMELIQNVTFCKVFVWKADSEKDRAPEKNFALRLKRHWWFVVETVFNATLKGHLFGGSLRGYVNDILFVEDDTIFAPDFIKVTWFASEVKRRNADIVQFALGSWSGENMINAHPDTFVVRTARDLRGIAYGFNQSTWLYFKTLENDYIEDPQHDWCESMGLVLGKHNGGKGFRIVVPTLSRIWHIGKKGLGPGGDFYFDRRVAAQPNWAHASRLLELKSARVNLGLRDLIGFLCKTRIEFWFLKDMECPFSMARWRGRNRNRIMCAKNPHVTDPCDVYV